MARRLLQRLVERLQLNIVSLLSLAIFDDNLLISANLAALKTDENLDISKNRYANRSLNKLDLNESPEPKRVAFTLFGHKRRVGSTSLEEMAALTGNVAERSTTPASSSSEMTIRRRNTAALDVDTDARRVTSSRSTRSRISHSPMGLSFKLGLF